MPANTSIKIDRPSTVYISFPEIMPKSFVVTASNGDIEYFRFLDGQTPRIKFNLVVSDEYESNVPIVIVKIVGIEIPELPLLPPPERDRYQGDPQIIYDPNWTESIASCFTDQNVIVHGPKWAALIPPVQLFIDLHEMGHFFYATEEYCDLYAFVNFLRMGYNRSTAFYTLQRVLKKTPQNGARLKYLFDNLLKSTGEFSPE